MELPVKALSVRQPWAWAIIHGGKDIENRSWQAVNHGLNFRGRVAIHASKTMGQRDYQSARDFICSLCQELPEARDLERGGIIGSVEILGVVKESDSPWFFGPRGLVLANAEPCDFIPVKGCLGFFNWRDHLTDHVPEPARWMLPEEPKIRHAELHPTLFWEAP